MVLLESFCFYNILFYDFISLSFLFVIVKIYVFFEFFKISGGVLVFCVYVVWFMSCDIGGVNEIFCNK